MNSEQEIYAWITEGEGILAGFIGGGWMPLVSLDRELALKMEPVARDVSEKLGKKINLYKFSNCELIE
jgi:hypothetical protein